MIIRIDNAGDTLWTKLLGESSNDQATAIRETADGGLIVSGFTSSGGALDQHAWLIRLGSDDPTGIADPYSTVPEGFSLAQNFPNPFNPTTIIGYSIPEVAMVTLSVFDILGKEVATVVHELRTPGTYTEPFDASDLATGIYLYRLTTPTFQATKKFIVVK